MPHRLPVVSRVIFRTAVTLLLVAPVSTPALAQTAGLPLTWAPARSPDLRLHVGPALGNSPLGGLSGLTLAASADWTWGSAQVGGRVVDFTSEGRAFETAWGVLTSWQVAPLRTSRRIRGIIGVGRSVVSTGTARLEQTDVPLGLGVGWVPGLPFAQASVWAAPRLQYRAVTLGSVEADQIGGGLSFGVELVLRRRGASARRWGIGPWFTVDLLRIGGDGLPARTEAQLTLGGTLHYQP